MACKTSTNSGSVISIYFLFITIFIFLFQFDSSKAKWPLLVELCPCILHAHRFLSYSPPSLELLLFSLRPSYYSLKYCCYSLPDTAVFIFTVVSPLILFHLHWILYLIRFLLSLPHFIYFHFLSFRILCCPYYFLFRLSLNSF